MKFFIDSANINEIKEGISLGMVDGVTTNPSLIAKEKRGFEEVVKEILEVVDGPVSLEIVGSEAKGMVQEGKKIGETGRQRRNQGSHDHRGLESHKDLCRLRNQG